MSSLKSKSVLLAALAFVGAAVCALGQPVTESPQEAWLTYHDDFYDVTLKYPSDWNVIPHRGSEEIGGVITFIDRREAPASAESDPHGPKRRIVFGLYLTPRPTGMTMDEWQTLRRERLSPYGKSYGSFFHQEVVRVAGRAAWQTEESTPLGRSRVTEVPRGEAVWFLWDDDSLELTRIYDRMLRSVRFGPEAPRSPVEVFGPEFAQFPTVEPANVSPATPITKGLSTYRVPFNGLHIASCSDTHNNVYTQYAVDVFVSVGRNVYAAYSGSVLHADWWGNYGKLIKILSEPNEHFYGHLNNYKVWVGKSVSKGDLIGESGDTGPGSAHLHFEVRQRYQNVGLDLSGVSGFNENSNYPGQNGQQVISCGTWFK